MKNFRKIISEHSQNEIHGRYSLRWLSLDSVRWFHTIVFLLFFGFLIISAEESRYREFVVVGERSHIPMSGITSLALDDNGFIWGASRIGIIRATPSNVSIYHLPVATSDVMQIKLAYNKGMLVAASQNGQIFRLDMVKDRFEKLVSLADILGIKEWISNILIDDEGSIWISTSVGIFVFSDGELKRFSSESYGYSFIQKCEGNDIFAIDDEKIFIISGEMKDKDQIPGNFSQFVSSAAYDKYRKRILIGTYQGELWEYDMTDKTLLRFEEKAIPELIIRSVLVPDSDVFLLGMEGGGIIEFDAKTNKIKNFIKEDIDNPASLRGNSVFAMTVDKQDRLWVATTSAGLQYAEVDGDDSMRIQHIFNSPSSIHNNEINFLLSSDSGSLWAATNDGISIGDIRNGTWKQLLGHRQLSVLSLAQDAQGRIYASTYGHGIYVIDPVSLRQIDHFTDKDADIFGKGNYVFSSFRDSDGDIWFGGVKGVVVCYSPENRTFKKYETHPVFCFAEQAPGKILTGGGDGLILFDKATGESATILGDNVVQQILVDGDLLWICTSGNGIIKIDQTVGLTSILSVNEGLPSNFTRSIAKIDDKLWIGTALGLGCYDIKNQKMLRLPGKDMFTRNAFRENSSAILPDGKLALGTNNGIVSFYPDKILDHKSQGRIFFSDIRVSGRSIRATSDIVLSEPIDKMEELMLNYPHDSFTLSLLAIGNVGSNVMYSWKLDGLDVDWTGLSAIPFINYINLNPGKYTLVVRMFDGGIVSERKLKIVVKPPFWNTLWFRIIIILLVFLVILSLVRHYLIAMRRRHAFEKLLLSLQIADEARHPLRIEMDMTEREDSNETSDEDSASENIIDVPYVEDSVACIDNETELNISGSVIDNEFLAKAMECVKANLSNESFGKGEFADAMSISQSLLYKKIKALTDMSVVEFIRSIRLNHAMALLGTARYNVTEVSEMCGFSSSAYFSRVFKESFGKNPSDLIPK